MNAPNECWSRCLPACPFRAAGAPPSALPSARQARECVCRSQCRWQAAAPYPSPVRARIPTACAGTSVQRSQPPLTDSAHWRGREGKLVASTARYASGPAVPSASPDAAQRACGMVSTAVTASGIGREKKIVAGAPPPLACVAAATSVTYKRERGGGRQPGGRGCARVCGLWHLAWPLTADAEAAVCPARHGARRSLQRRGIIMYVPTTHHHEAAIGERGARRGARLWPQRQLTRQRRQAVADLGQGRSR